MKPFFDIYEINKYSNWYFKIIGHAKQQNRIKNQERYFENHHIVPGSIKPEWKKEKWNKVLLTAREHFICHLLLLKMCRYKKHYHQMLCAMNFLAKRGKSAKTYEKFRIEHKNLMILISTGLKRSNEAKYKMRLAKLGKKHSEETKQKLSNLFRGRPGIIPNEETREKMRIAKLGKPGNHTQKHSEETKKKIKEKRALQIITSETKQKLSNVMKGRVFSEEHKRNLSIAAKNRSI